MQIPTVKIASADGKDYIIINADEYDPENHKLIEGEVADNEPVKPNLPFDIDPIEDARRSAILIPDKPEALSAGDAKLLASEITKPEGKTFATKVEALAEIEVEIERRLNK